MPSITRPIPNIPCPGPGKYIEKEFSQHLHRSAWWTHDVLGVSRRIQSNCR